MDKGTSRLEAFSDGVFGIALTLLVLEFHLPDPTPAITDKSLLRELLALWPSAVAFTISFAVVLIMWINHHELLRLVRKADYALFYANGAVLLTVTFIPFPTTVLARHLGTHAANASAAFYCGSFLMTSIAWSALLAAISWNRRLVRPEVSDETIIRLRRAYAIGFFVYATSVAVAFWNAIAGLVLCASLWFMWMRLCYGGDDALGD